MLKSILINLIGIYQGYIRIGLFSSCRFSPTCSEYAKQAIYKYGVFKGGYKGVARILKCHPWSGESGYDPIV